MTEISKEYAVALFELANTRDEQRETNDALHEIAAVLAASPEYMYLLDTPSIPKQERVQAIEQAFGGRVPERVLSFMQLLCEHGHIREFPRCAEEYRQLLQQAEGVSVARVVSAVALTEEEKHRLVSRLETLCGHRVELECVCDEGLLGGMTVSVDGMLLDGSVKHRLHEVKEVMNR